MNQPPLPLIPNRTGKAEKNRAKGCKNEIKKVTGSLLILKLDTGPLFFAIFLDKTPTGYLDLKVTKFYQIGPTNLPPPLHLFCAKKVPSTFP